MVLIATRSKALDNSILLDPCQKLLPNPLRSFECCWLEPLAPFPVCLQNMGTHKGRAGLDVYFTKSLTHR